MNTKMLPVWDTKIIGKSKGIFSSLDSTNNYAKSNAHLVRNGHVVVASEQLSGRGRQGKSFYSPENGGLYMSVVIKDKTAVEDGLFTVKACVAVCRAIDRLCSSDEKNGVGIKWVNDIYFGGKKLCGILCEKFADEGGETCIVAGFGINLKLDNSRVPSELRKIVTSIYDMTKKRHDPMVLCGYICQELERLVLDGNVSNEDVIAEYKRRSVVIGKEISIVTEGEEPVRAAALDICTDGALLVRTQDGDTRKLCGGEISIKVKK